MKVIMISPLRLESVIVKIDKNKINVGDKVVYKDSIYKVLDVDEDNCASLDDGFGGTPFIKRDFIITKEDLR